MAENNNNSSSVVEFENFFQGWMVRQEHYLDELLSAERNCDECGEEDMEDLVSRVLAHYQQYYEEKSRILENSVFLLFSPPWFTPLERSFLWIAGFKPGLAFRIVANSVGELSENQGRRMRRLKEETRTVERLLHEELARIQESMAAPPLLELARRARRRVDGEIVDSDAVVELLRTSMETVLTNADLLRRRTAVKVTEILAPAQNIKFLAAVGRLQVKIRNWGLQRNTNGGAND